MQRRIARTLKRLDALEGAANAYTFEFAESQLSGVRDSYTRELQRILHDPRNQSALEGGRALHGTLGGPEAAYFVVSYGHNPLLWISANNAATFSIFEEFFDRLRIRDDIRQLVDHRHTAQLYSAFFVVCDRAPAATWHLDYVDGANAYTLITPLFSLAADHGHLLYRHNARPESSCRFDYEIGRAIVFGDGFPHSTEPFRWSSNLRVLVSLTFGTDDNTYWPLLRKTLGRQARYVRLPCGHEFQSCICAGDQAVTGPRGSSSPRS